MISVTQLRQKLDELDITDPDITKVGVITPPDSVGTQLRNLSKDVHLATYHDGGEAVQAVWLLIE